ncbi:glycerol-3-phosphate dehydrogenase [Pararobbsia alpina]|uniref:NAD(P)H-dependent glycerol-3-phosphate dehydrogenase n=1 Tax=Pararobbsia alpina TaxID=621374 RepID=UPI0039A6D1C8
MKVAVLGAGAWGTALAAHLGERHDTVLWARDAALVAALARDRRNTAYLPSAALPDGLRYEADLATAIRHACDDDALVVAATPVAGLRMTCEAMRAQSCVPANLIWLCKGFEQETHLLPHQVVHQVLGDHPSCGALSGPSFAREVAAHLPVALTIASASEVCRARTVEAFHAGAMRIYTGDDVVGVEVGGAVKNVLAIATGIADGMSLGLNARAALVTRGLAEMTRLGVALGGRADTFMGLTGIGDLILTATGDLSRNRTVGLELAKGRTLKDILDSLGHVAEGVRCAQAVAALARANQVEMPITETVCAVLFEGLPPADAVDALLRRDARAEGASE